MKFRQYKDKMKQKIEAKRLYFQIKDRINHCSVTIPPAPKYFERNEIESLYQAIKYYKDNNVNKIILQTKYMGSYMTVYLNKDIEKSRFFSRNLYFVPIDKEKLINAVKPLHDKLFNKYLVENFNKEVDEVVIEGELMRWTAISGSYIDKDYRNYQIVNENNLNFLKKSNIIEKLKNIENSDSYKDFLANGTDKAHIKRQYGSFTELKSFVNLEDYTKTYENSLNIFKRQLEVFAQPTVTPYFEAFKILKYYFYDNTELVEKNNGLYSVVNNREFLVLDLSDDFDKNVELAYEFYNKHINLEEEGIMVKPLIEDNILIASCFKVRTNSYLQMIYGLDFDTNYHHYLLKRNIKRKLEAHIKDNMTKNDLLNIKKSDLNDKNSLYVSLLKNFISGESETSKLDYRL
jgi:hypothetical protein